VIGVERGERGGGKGGGGRGQGKKSVHYPFSPYQIFGVEEGGKGGGGEGECPGIP